MKNSVPKPINTRLKLTSAAQKLRQDCIDHWEIEDPAGLTTLAEMCACFDRLQAAKRLLSKHGGSVTDRFGQPKLSPWFLMVRDETTVFVRLQKALNLEITGLANRPGRPDGFRPEIIYGAK
jgi:hypothetical protein